MLGVFQSHPSGSAGIASRAGLVARQALQVMLARAAETAAVGDGEAVDEWVPVLFLITPLRMIAAATIAAARRMAGSHYRKRQPTPWLSGRGCRYPLRLCRRLRGRCGRPGRTPLLAWIGVKCSGRHIRRHRAMVSLIADHRINRCRGSEGGSRSRPRPSSTLPGDCCRDGVLQRAAKLREVCYRMR